MSGATNDQETISGETKENIFFCAVGGTDNVRQSRASLLSTLGIEPSHYVPSQIGEWPFPNWIEKLDIQQNQTPPMDFTFTPNDIILMVGKVNEQELIKQIGTAGPKIYLQGPGFNYGGFGSAKQGHMDNLSDACQEMVNVEGDDCYAYEYKEMNALCGLFPPALQKLRTYQVGGFWATRNKDFLRTKNGITTGAFYRQFGMTGKISRGEYYQFEIDIARKANLEHIANKIENMTDIQSVADFFTRVYGFYQENPPTSEQVALLSSVLLDAASREEAVVKEYDGLVAHVMLRSLAGYDEPRPTKEEHMTFMRACVNGEETNAVQELRARIPNTNRIFVFHDLGMDPQNDDWIAINIVKHILAPSNQYTSARFKGISGLVKNIVIESSMGANGLEGHYRVLSHIQEALINEGGDHLTANQFTVFQSIFATQQHCSIDMAKEVLDAHGVDMNMAQELIFDCKNWSRV
jgi:hypothetical protein